MIAVPTIPHTGTHFMRYHLLHGHDCFVDHIWPNQIAQWLPLLQDATIIVPLRDPRAVACSWAKRAHLPGALQLEELPTWWRLLITEVDPLRPYYLPIDRPIVRDQCLAHINCCLGLELQTDWPLIREKDGTAGSHYDEVGLTDEEYRVAVVDVLREYTEFFGRWYYPPMHALPTTSMLPLPA